MRGATVVALGVAVVDAFVEALVDGLVEAVAVAVVEALVEALAVAVVETLVSLLVLLTGSMLSRGSSAGCTRSFSSSTAGIEVC